MQVTVESPSQLQRRLTITVPIDQLDAIYDKKIADFAKTANLKGFRPGKAPINFVKQRYGDSARQEALSEIIQNSLINALTQEKLSPIGMPQVETKTIAADKPLEFVASFEVLPDITDIHFASDELEKLTAAVTENDVTKVIDRLREQSLTWVEVERAAQLKDQVIIDFRGTLDGKAFDGGEAHAYPIVLGSNSMIPGFEEGILGLKKGEEKVVKVTFPEEYHAKEFAGKPAEFAITVIKVSEPNLPELNDQLIKKLGIKSGLEADLSKEIQKNLEREAKRLSQAKLKSKVFDLLIEQNPLEIPQTLIEQEANRIHDEMHPHHKGKDHGHSADEMSGFNAAAKQNVSLSLLINEFIKKHKLKVDQKRVQDHLNILASSYEHPEEVIKWYTSDKKRMEEIHMQVLEEQVIDQLLEATKVVEKNVSYDELVR